ncbi:MAG: lysozyme inhibitor LprI family protein [Campylobacter sp.]
MKKLILIGLFLGVTLHAQTELTSATKECLKRVNSKQDIQYCLDKNQPKTQAQIKIENLQKNSPACKEMDMFSAMDCASIEEKLYDDILNQEYKKAMNGLKVQKIKDNLKDAQRKWIAYRDAKCVAEHPLPGYNNTETFGYSDCLTNTTKQRAQELKNIVENLQYYNDFAFLDDKTDIN